MHPVVLELGGVTVGSYGLALFLAFALGIGIGVHRARAGGLDAEPVLGVAIVVVVSSIVGSRLFFTFFPPEPTSAGWLARLTATQGLSVMGGLPAGLLCSWLYFRLRSLPVATYMDLLAPSVAFGAGVTRIGCFLNGCCHGSVCELPWGMRFPADSLAQARLGEVAVHPTQLYQALAGFAIGFGLLAYARRNPPAGSVLFALICTWGLQRLAIEPWRFRAGAEVAWQAGDWVVSVYQLMALALVAVGISGWLGARRGWSLATRA